MRLTWPAIFCIFGKSKFQCAEHRFGKDIICPPGMELFFAIAFFTFGLILGSFLNVCIYRLPRDLSVVAPRSACPQCGHTIRAYDNIPILSWILLRGRCRDCHARISPRYAAVELLNGVLFLAC